MEEQEKELDEIFYVRTEKHWKAVAHPLRHAIVRLLRQRPMTNEELARALGVASGKLHFHTRQLLGAGLIRLVGTRQKHAITEKLYRATAKRLLAAPPTEDESELSRFQWLESAVQLYEHTVQEFPDLFAPDNHLANHSLLQVPPEKADELLQRLLSLVEDAIASRTTTPGSVTVALTVLMYPLPGPLPWAGADSPASTPSSDQEIQT